MEINATAIEDISDGNAVCKLCISYLTLGKNDEVKRDNLHVHFNGRKHKFHRLCFEKSFNSVAIEDDYQPVSKTELCFSKGSSEFLFLGENGISYDTNHNLKFYCSFCDCVLPQLSKDKRLNVFNINVHLLSKRHNFSVVSNLAKRLIVENENNKYKEIFTTNIIDSVVRIPYLFSSITAAFYFHEEISLEKVFNKIPDQLQDHKSTIIYDESNGTGKFACSLCICSIGVPNDRIKIVGTILCHIKGKRHLKLYKYNEKNNTKTISFDEVDDANLKKVLKLINSNKVIIKNEKYILRNSCDNIVCKLCKCVLPGIGKADRWYLSAIQNFQLHFLGKQHSRLVKHDLKMEMTKSIKSDDDSCNNSNLMILKIFNESVNLSKDHVDHFMISKSSNLICKICSCAIRRNVASSPSNAEVATSIETHIQTRTHLRNYSYKQGIKNYKTVTNSNKLNLNIENKGKIIPLCGFSDCVIKVDSCGQLVCSSCQKIIAIKYCDLELAVSSHLKGKTHKRNNSKNQNTLSKSILNEILDSLPSDYNINKKCLIFIFGSGIVNCSICNYMFRINNDYGLRNNLMTHITSFKHNKLLNKYRISIGDNDYKTGNGYSVAIDYNNFTTTLANLGDKVFLDRVFDNYIPKSLHLHKKFVSLRSSELFCNACNLGLLTPLKLSAAVQILINHFVNALHKKKAMIFELGESCATSSFLSKTFTKKSLSNILGDYIPKSITQNRQFIKIISNKLFCNVCQSYLIGINQLNKTVVRKLKLHFLSDFHKNNFEKFKDIDDGISDNLINSESCGNIAQCGIVLKELNVSDLFVNFVDCDLRFNERYISYKNNLKKLFCNLCDCIISPTNHLQSTESNLIEHLKGSDHRRNLENIKNCEKILPINSTFELPNSASAVQSDGVGYLEGCVPKSFVMKVGTELHGKSSLCSNDSHNVNTYDNTFLNGMFSNHIPSDLQFNKWYFMIKNRKIVCRICNCCVKFPEEPTTAAYNLIDHLKSALHKKNLLILGIEKKKLHNSNYNSTLFEKQEQLLDDLFTNYIAHDIQFNRQFIIQNSNIMICSICKCRLPKSEDPKITGKNLSDHLKGTFHQKQMKTEHTIGDEERFQKKFSSSDNDGNIEKSEKCLDFVFTKFIQRDYQLNRKYIIFKADDFICNICNFKLSFSNNPRKTAENIMVHLKRSFHRNNMKKLECSHKEPDMRRADDELTNDSLKCNKIFVSNNSDLINDLFTKFIPEDFHFNQQYICIASNEIICKLCSNFRISCVITQTTAQNLLKHLKSISHEVNLLDDVFKNFISDDLKINQKYIKIESQKIICDVCDCMLSNSSSPEIIAAYLVEHIKGKSHSVKLKQKYVDGEIHKNHISNPTDCSDSSENCLVHLDDLFKKFIRKDFQFNRTFVDVKSNELFCNICCCKLSNSDCCETTANILLDHFEGQIHKCNLEKRGVNDSVSEIGSVKVDNISCKTYEKLLDDVFTNFIEKDYEFHRQHIVVKLNQLACNICDCILFKPSIPVVTALMLMEHLKGSTHVNNLKAKDKLVDKKNNEPTKRNDNVWEKNESSLDNLFENLVSKFSDKDFLLNRKYFVVEHNDLVCTLCDCILSWSQNSHIATKILSEHLTGAKHDKKFKQENLVNSPSERSSEEYNDSLKNDSIFLEYLFSNNIDDVFQTNKKYIVVDSNKVACKLCNSFKTRTENLQASQKWLMDHFQETLHKNNLETVMVKSVNQPEKNPCSASSSCVNKSSYNYKKVLDDIFSTFIDDLKLSRQFISEESNNFICMLCKFIICPVSLNSDITAKHLVNHLTGMFHEGNLNTKHECENSPGSSVDHVDKTCEKDDLKIKNVDKLAEEKSVSIKKPDKPLETDQTFLDDVFTLICTSLQINRSYIVLKLKSVFCNICDIKLCKPTSQRVVANMLIQHLRGEFHQSNLKKVALIDHKTENKSVNSQSSSNHYSIPENIEHFLDDMFANFIPDDFQFNRPFLTGTRNKIFCDICIYIAANPVNPQVTANTLMQHFNGSKHKYNLKTKTINKTSVSENSTDFKNANCPFQIDRSKFKNMNNKQSENKSDLVQVSGNSFENNQTILDDIFTNNIDDDFQFNKKYIVVESNGVVCKLCNVFENKSESPHISRKWLLDHFKETVHKNNLLRDISTDKLGKNTICASESSYEKNKIFLDDIYASFIDSDVKSSRQFIAIESNNVTCTLCNHNVCSLSVNFDCTAKHLMNHLKGDIHQGYLKTKNINISSHANFSSSVDACLEKVNVSLQNVDSNVSIPKKISPDDVSDHSNLFEADKINLDEIFAQFIPKNIYFNRQYVQMKSDKLICNICGCTMFMSANPEATSKVLIEHLKGGAHNYYLRKGTVASKITDASFATGNNCDVNLFKNPSKFLDDVFVNFIPHNYQFNRQYIINKSHKFICKICNCMLSLSRSPQSASQNILSHLKGNFHETSLKNLDK